jgi:seryl-tRNA synthetase
MLDVHFVRANFELVKQKLEQRGFPIAALERFSALDERRRTLVRERDDLKALRNSESQEIGILMKSGLKDDAESRRSAVRERGVRITAAETELTEVEGELDALMTTIPNLAHETVPIGSDDSANIEAGRSGEPPAFDFEPRDHVDLAAGLGILDLERAAKIAGSRFAILTGQGARLERALINFCLDVQTKKHGYQEVLPPFIVNANTLFGTGQLPKF